MSLTQGFGPPTVQVKAELTLFEALFQQQRVTLVTAARLKRRILEDSHVCLFYKYGGCVIFVVCLVKEQHKEHLDR